MPEFNLTPVQERAARAIAKGHTRTAAAQKAGVSRRTIYNWLDTLTDFDTAVDTFRQECRQIASRESEAAVHLAIGSLIAILNDPNALASTRVEAALAILNSREAHTGGIAHDCTVEGFSV